MTRLVIGSTAMELYVRASRAPDDLDVFTDEPGAFGDVFWHPSFAGWLMPGTDRYARLDELYTIKVSHSYWDLRNGSWEKHMADQVALREAGAVLDQALHDLLYKVWEEKHGKKQVNLAMDKEDFFADAVTRVYDHDSIHESVAYGQRPMYESVVADGHTVKMDMAKVWAMPESDIIRLFREEIYATALERWVIPSDYRCSPRTAYAKALQNTITSLTKGRSAQFISERYSTFRVPDMDYVSHHRSRSHFLRPVVNIGPREVQQ